MNDKQDTKSTLMAKLEAKESEILSLENEIELAEGETTKEQRKLLLKLKDKRDELVRQIADSTRLKEIFLSVQAARGGRTVYRHSTIAEKQGKARVTISSILNGHLAINRDWLIFFSKEFDVDPRRISPEMVDADQSIIHALNEDLLTELSGMSHEDKTLFRQILKALKSAPKQFRQSILGAASSFNASSASKDDKE